MDKEVAGHRYTHERTHTTPDLGKSNGLREANLDLKHKSQACSQGEPIDQKYEWSHVSIEHQVGKVSHDEKDEVFSSARVKLILEFETKCYLQTICLSGRGSGREVRGKEGRKEEKEEEWVGEVGEGRGGGGRRRQERGGGSISNAQCGKGAQTVQLTICLLASRDNTLTKAVTCRAQDML